jgi:hypothetical protein
MKKCIKCVELKSIEEYNKGNNQCKNCVKEYKRLYFLKNKDFIKEKLNLLSDDERNRRKIIKKKLNDSYIISDERKEKNKIRRREYHKIKMKTDILYRLKHGFQRRLNKSLNRGKFVHSTTIEILDIIGCTFDDFKKHLEDRFEIWMSWDNYGLYNGELNYGWDIDHIIPVSNAINEQEIFKLNHYSNLQPLCSKINRDIKRNKN